MHGYSTVESTELPLYQPIVAQGSLLGKAMHNHGYTLKPREVR